jgi:transcriptional regulator with XRE-family HTH domain
LRKSRKITLIKLAEDTDISKSALSDYETGKSNPVLDTLLKISMYFNMPMDKLTNSDISEYVKSQSEPIGHDASKSDWISNDIENERYNFHLKLLHLKVESTKLQMQLLRQLLESKDAENKTLKINLKLLEEQFKNRRSQ